MRASEQSNDADAADHGCHARLHSGLTGRLILLTGSAIMTAHHALPAAKRSRWG